MDIYLIVTSKLENPGRVGRDIKTLCQNVKNIRHALKLRNINEHGVLEMA